MKLHISFGSLLPLSSARLLFLFFPAATPARTLASLAFLCVHKRGWSTCTGKQRKVSWKKEASLGRKAEDEERRRREGRKRESRRNAERR